MNRSNNEIKEENDRMYRSNESKEEEEDDRPNRSKKRIIIRIMIDCMYRSLMKPRINVIIIMIDRIDQSNEEER